MRRLALLLGFSFAPLASAATPPQQPPLSHPPRPKVSTLGATGYASLVSYCWHEDGRGVCADGVAGSPRQTIAWRADREVRIDFRVPAHDVSVSTARVSAAAPYPEIRLRARRLDKEGRRYLVRIPSRSRGDDELLLFARFEQGDLFAELGLRRVR
jgi:hypothetical protein